MTDLTDATREALGWKLIADAVAERLAEARGRLEELMAANSSRLQEHREPLHGDPATNIYFSWGTASRSADGWDGVIDDEAALLNWAVQNRPDMVRRTLDPTWLKYLRNVAAIEGQAVDRETGAVIPGVTRVRKTGGLTIRPSAAAKRGARALIQQMALGELSITEE